MMIILLMLLLANSSCICAALDLKNKDEMSSEMVNAVALKVAEKLAISQPIAQQRSGMYKFFTDHWMIATGLTATVVGYGTFRYFYASEAYMDDKKNQHNAFVNKENSALAAKIKEGKEELTLEANHTLEKLKTTANKLEEIDCQLRLLEKETKKQGEGVNNLILLTSEAVFKFNMQMKNLHIRLEEKRIIDGENIKESFRELTEMKELLRERNKSLEGATETLRDQNRKMATGLTKAEASLGRIEQHLGIQDFSESNSSENS